MKLLGPWEEPLLQVRMTLTYWVGACLFAWASAAERGGQLVARWDTWLHMHACKLCQQYRAHAGPQRFAPLSRAPRTISFPFPPRLCVLPGCGPLLLVPCLMHSAD